MNHNANAVGIDLLKHALRQRPFVTHAAKAKKETNAADSVTPA
jgi:hypothetical protein